MRKKQDSYKEQEDNPFALSTGDLMAGLLFIFILLLMSAMLDVQEKAEQDEALVQQYDNTKALIYEDLSNVFKDSLSAWGATIEPSLIVRFQEPSMLFDEGKDSLKVRFRQILDSFFPTYISVLSKPEYKENIEEIRIEGHTNSNGEYFKNMKLSQNRTRVVLQYCLKLTPEENQDWAQGLITANGLSSSHVIVDENGTEDKDKSRRVEFRVRTNAEQQLEQIAQKRRNND